MTAQDLRILEHLLHNHRKNDLSPPGQKALFLHDHWPPPHQLGRWRHQGRRSHAFLSFQGPHTPRQRAKLGERGSGGLALALPQGWPRSRRHHTKPGGESCFPSQLLCFSPPPAPQPTLGHLHLTNQPQNPKEHRCSCCAVSSLHLKGKTTGENTKGETCNSDTPFSLRSGFGDKH